MISHLRGSVHRLDHGEVAVDVSGVGYRVSVPIDVFESLAEGETAMLWIATYVREDRLDLFGFRDRAGRTLFEEFLKIAGIGPRLALELCAVPRSMLSEAIGQENARLLTGIKGIGQKTAEKLLVELRSLAEKHPGMFAGTATHDANRHEYDRDAVAALTALGYDAHTATRALRELSGELQSTEERVAAALRSL